jgi:3-oxoacyl-[acyl-carrier protein] reductase
VVNYQHNKERAEKIVREILDLGRKAFSIQADISDKEQVFHMVKEVIKKFGKVDILVNNAGITTFSPSVLEASYEDWKTTLSIDLIGPYYGVQAVAPFMIKQRYGKIINISSNAALGIVGSGRYVTYAPAKAGLIVLTKKLAYELGQYNINVNAIAPGITRTEIMYVGRSQKEVKDFIEEKTKLTALRRIGDPKDIANVALFLASDESSFVTGQLIVVDGGRYDYLSHSQ